MKTVTIDNSINVLAAILWQYDKAPNLIALLGAMNDFATLSTKNFWDYYASSVFNIKNADSFGLSVWGSIIGIARPSVTINGVIAPISDGFYRRILLGKFFLYNSNYSMADLNMYLKIVFGNRVTVTDGLDMSINYVASGTLTDEESALLATNSGLIYEYPAGVKSNSPATLAGILGLNDSQESGQNKENLALNKDDSNGGAFYSK